MRCTQSYIAAPLTCFLARATHQWPTWLRPFPAGRGLMPTAEFALCHTGMSTTLALQYPQLLPSTEFLKNRQRQHTCATRFGMSWDGPFVNVCLYVCACKTGVLCAVYVRKCGRVSACANGCPVCVRPCEGVCVCLCACGCEDERADLDA